MRFILSCHGLRVVGLLSWLAVATSVAHAGAWTQEEGRNQLIFATQAMAATGRFDGSGKLTKADRFLRIEMNQLLEYGWRPDTTLMLLSPQKRDVFTAGGATQSLAATGLGVGLRQRLWSNDGFVLSVQATASGIYERTIPVAPRRYEPRHEADARVLAGYGFEVMDRPAFIDIQAGYRWRGARHNAEVRLDATLGWRPFERILVLMQSFTTSSASGRQPRQQQHKLQFSTVVALTDTWSVQVGAFRSVSGRNALQENGVIGAVWRKF